MAEILGLGLSHYPPLSGLDRNMAGLLRWTLEDPAIPAAAKDPANWPAPMREEWGDDCGENAAARHRVRLVECFDHIRSALDDFKPDAIVIWGDDQYENFREDVVPPFTVCAYDDMDVQPWKHAEVSGAMKGKPNIWGEPLETSFRVRGRPELARFLVQGLLARHIDVAYAYRPLHHPGIPHAFLNAVLYLDYHRRGFEYPVVAFPINCYGRRLVSTRGFMTRLNDPIEFDPPAPAPARLMDVGRAAARVLADSPWRVALVASSSWSHAFLCDKTYRLRPDTDSDRRLYRALQSGDFEVWRRTSLDEIENAGQQEVLSWFPLMGAMEELGSPLAWSDWVETDVFNSNKVFVVFEPA